MVIDYYATKLVEEWPAELTGLEVEKRLYEAALKMEGRINKFINKTEFNVLITYMLDQQSFDRDPYGWMDENGHPQTVDARWSWKVYFEDIISDRINQIAGV